MTTFKDLGLAEPLLKALDAESYVTPTPIQAQAIPHVLAGRDLQGIAQTGTGKTAAFSLPMLQRLGNGRPNPRSCRALILSPTRELASQIQESIRVYGRFVPLSSAVVFGGVSIGKQIRDLSRGVDILVATPGRLLDLIDQRAVTLADVSILVLDEADQMLDMGFIHAIRRLAGLVPKKRQTLFFSATMPKEIAELAARFLTDPVHVAVAPVATTAERVRQEVMFVDTGRKQALLHTLLADESIDRALVFTRTKHGADKVVRRLGLAGVPSAAIHGNKSQPQRERALAEFKAGKIRLLVATDIAARGIDIEAVSHVINFDLPNVPESYVHRIGRTARAGAEGIAISFCDREERAFLRDIERVIRQKVPVRETPAELADAPMPAAEPRQPQARPAHGQGRPGGHHRAGGRPQQGRGEGRGHGGPAAAGQGERQGRPHGQPGEPRRDKRDGGRPFAKPEGQQRDRAASNASPDRWRSGSSEPTRPTGGDGPRRQGRHGRFGR